MWFLIELEAPNVLKETKNLRFYNLKIFNYIPLMRRLISIFDKNFQILMANPNNKEPSLI